MSEPNTDSNYNHYKDVILDGLGTEANIAQFVSFNPQLEQRFSLVREFERNHTFSSLEEAAKVLLNAAPEKLVNVRSYTPEDPKSREFVSKLKSVDEVIANVSRLASQGLYTIINETIDEKDGGISGVAVGDVIEFAPDDIPRAVEKPGTVALPRRLGLNFIKTVYGFDAALDYSPFIRVEFSVHPLRRGYRNEHTTVWELEDVGNNKFTPVPKWPNNFSRKIGDKAFGLLIAYLYGLPVPRTTVIPRAIAPFSFGNSTGTAEIWIRTCPKEPVPGFFTTRRGWIDPFKLLADEDTQGNAITSVLAQEGVEAFYSGALVSDEFGNPIIEGVRGFGDDFMLGVSGTENLPEEIIGKVKEFYESVRASLGSVRMEWVFDGEQVWVVQLHRGATATSNEFIYPGAPANYRYFETREGIAALRQLITDVQITGEGIILRGNVGITSHFGDVLRKAQIPSKIERA
ncbi:MAG TPA: hypothetical protein VF721_11260 [Pyrinomonadaceae bacterium]|jgi:hypothetical protein